MPDIHYQRDMRPINGAFKGRGRDYLALLACPLDGGRLHLEEGAVRCTADAAHVYPFEDGILRLVPADRRPALDAESGAHEERCARAGWAVPDEAQFKALPQTGLPGYPLEYWPGQAAGTALLWRFLEKVRLRKGEPPVGPMGEAAVVGAEMGWLAYGLDVAGYTTLAIDAHAGPGYGLGVYPIARYLRVQADLNALPLARAAFDWVILQSGLARFGNEAAQQRALGAALDALRPGGWVAVMEALASPAENVAAVQALLRAAGLVVEGDSCRSGWRGRALGLRDRLAGRESGVPSVLVAQKLG
ncbi:MAG: hypothetical protein AB1435_11310 [Chloroflexota bacterium]